MAFETIALGLGVGGAAIGAYGSLYKGAAETAAADYNAALLTRNAGIARDQAAADAEDKAREGRRYLGALHAAFGASGLAMEGSALDVYQDSATEAALAVHRIRYGGELRALGLEADSALQSMRADAAGSAALVGAASHAAQGFGSYATWQDRQDRIAASELARSINRERLRPAGSLY